MTLRELSTAYNNRSDSRYPSVPVYAKTQKTFTDNSTNELRDAILAYFDLKGIKAWPVATEGRYIAEKWEANTIGQKVQTQKGMYIPRSKKAVGVADIAVVLPPKGRYLAIEQKLGSDRQREGQKEFQQAIEAMGGLYIIVKTWEDFIFQVEKIL